MAKRSGWTAMVLPIAMVAGCETITLQHPGGVGMLTSIQMDQVTAGSAVAVNEAAAHALGSAPQTAVLATTFTYSGRSRIAGIPLLNYASSQVTASASNGEFAQAGLSSHISVDGDNGGAWVDAAAIGAAAGSGTSHARVSTRTYGVSTSRADLVFGSVTAAACCGSSATARLKVDSGAGGSYSRELRSDRGPATTGQAQSNVDFAVVSSALAILDPAQVPVAGAPARTSLKY
jgi:hypothetical protein